MYFLGMVSVTEPFEKLVKNREKVNQLFFCRAAPTNLHSLLNC